MISSRTLTLTAAIAAMAFGVQALVTPSAFAFWNIWRPSDPPQGGRVPPQPLKDVRESSCGKDNAVTVFGETAYMRGEAPRASIPDGPARTIAAAYVAETVATAQSILAPLLGSPDRQVAGAARLSLAFIALRRQPTAMAAPRLALELLDSPLPDELEADRHYLRAALAMQDGRWLAVATEAKEALKRSPDYYNAQVLYSLARLRQIQTTGFTAARCNTAMLQIEDLLLPLVRLGACPTHVAHFDLAAERYLPSSDNASALRSKIVRRTYLAYVSRNDRVGLELVAQYRQAFRADGCLARMQTLDFKQ